MTPDASQEYYKCLRKRFKAAKNDKELFQEIVDGPFLDKLHATNLGLGIVVFLQVNKKDAMLDRVALSNTEMAHNTLRITDVPFHEIRIPMSDPNNILIKAIKTGKPLHTVNWEYLFTPVLSGESARFNQAAGGVACSYVYPLESRDGGAMIFSFYTSAHQITKEHTKFLAKFIKIVDTAL